MKDIPDVDLSKAKTIDIQRGINDQVTGFTDLLAFTDFLYKMSARYGVSATESGAHAGENETSMMMALEGSLIAASRFAPGYLGPVREAEIKIIFEKGMPALTSNGILGDPRTATAERGEVYLERLADFLASEIGARTTD